MGIRVLATNGLCRSVAYNPDEKEKEAVQYKE